MDEGRKEAWKVIRGFGWALSCTMLFGGLLALIDDGLVYAHIIRPGVDAGEGLLVGPPMIIFGGIAVALLWSTKPETDIS